MTTTAPEMDRLRAARPPQASRTAQVSPPWHREAVLDSILVTASESPPQRTTSRFVAAAALVAALTGALALVPTDQAETTRPPARGAVTLLPDRIRLAVAAAEAGVVRIDADPGNGVLWEMWSDEAGGRSRSTSKHPDGRAIYDHEITSSDGTTSVVVVSHLDRAWWTYEAPTERGDVRFHPTPDELRAELEDGTLEEVGRSDREIHLRSTRAAKPGAPDRTSDLWVDAETFLPVRSVTAQPGGSRSVATFTWLDRTPENLASTRVEIPGDYRRLPSAPERPGEGAEQT